MEQHVFRYTSNLHTFWSHFCLQVICIFKTVIYIFAAPLHFYMYFWHIKHEGWIKRTLQIVVVWGGHLLLLNRTKRVSYSLDRNHNDLLSPHYFCNFKVYMTIPPYFSTDLFSVTGVGAVCGGSWLVAGIASQGSGTSPQGPWHPTSIRRCSC